MPTKEEERKLTLDHMIDERFAEIYFLAKEEFDIANNSPDEQKLHEMLENYKRSIKHNCKHHFENEV